jgi:hypothetical protein
VRGPTRQALIQKASLRLKRTRCIKGGGAALKWAPIYRAFLTTGKVALYSQKSHVDLGIVVTARVSESRLFSIFIPKHNEKFTGVYSKGKCSLQFVQKHSHAESDS